VLAARTVLQTDGEQKSNHWIFFFIFPHHG